MILTRNSSFAEIRDELRRYMDIVSTTKLPLQVRTEACIIACELVCRFWDTVKRNGSPESAHKLKDSVIDCIHRNDKAIKRRKDEFKTAYDYQDNCGRFADVITQMEVLTI